MRTLDDNGPARHLGRMTDGHDDNGDDNDNDGRLSGGVPGRTLSEAAQRALAEAAVRRELADRQAADAKPAPEVGGRDGPEPARYADWEVRGIAVDF